MPQLNNSQYKKQVIDQFLSLKGEIFNLFDDYLPENYTLVIRLSPELTNKIFELSETIKNKFPEQYYYPKENYHITLLGNIPTDKFSTEELKKIIKNNLEVSNVQIQLEGIGLSKNSVSIPGYPLNDSFINLRKKIRQATNSGDDYTIHKPFWENITWVNFIRFQSQPSDDFLEFLYSLRDEKLGALTNPKVELYLNSSRTLSRAHSQLVASF